MSASDLLREAEPLLAKIEAVATTQSILASEAGRSIGIHFTDPFAAKRVARMVGGLSSSYYDCEDGFTTYEGPAWPSAGEGGDPVNLCLYGPRDSHRYAALAQQEPAGTAVS